MLILTKGKGVVIMKDLIVNALDVIFFIPKAFVYRVILDKKMKDELVSEYPDNAFM